MSKGTTAMELCRIAGFSEWDRREIGVNLSGGRANAIELGCKVFKMPTPDAMLELFRAAHDLAS